MNHDYKTAESAVYGLLQAAQFALWIYEFQQSFRQYKQQPRLSAARHVVNTNELLACTVSQSCLDWPFDWFCEYT